MSPKRKQTSKRKKKNPWDLKPCPFCGCDEISMYEFGVMPDPHVRCDNCGASTRECDSRKAAIEAWHRRV